MRVLRVAFGLAVVIVSSGSGPPEATAVDTAGVLGAPWTTLFSYASPGFVDLRVTGSVTGTSDGRVKVAAPPRSSATAVRFELRDTDPGWPPNPTVQKSEVRTDTQQTFDKPAVSVGDVRWFSTRIYLPYTSRERFELAHGGSNPFTDLLELHTESSSRWAAFTLNMYPARADRYQWAYFRVFGGDFPSTRSFEKIRLWRLTNPAGKRVQANYNRWINLVWGMRFAPDNTGWLEAWVDGVNVYPRKNRPTMWSGDSGQYFKYGLYKQKDSSFPETGRSVIYFGRTTIGLTKP